MADDQSGGGSPIQWPALLALVAAVGGAAFYLSNLSSARPDVTTGRWRYAVGDQDIPARLWEDPFRMLDSGSGGAKASDDSESQKAAPSEAKEWTHRLNELRWEINNRGDSETLVLFVMVSAQPYAEIAEQRLRTRVAVGEGLARCGYEPEDGEHLGYFKTQWPWKPLSDRLWNAVWSGSWRQTTSAEPTLVVPYEWYKQATVKLAGAPCLLDKYRWEHVLVLWVNEDALLDDPLARLLMLQHCVRAGDGAAKPQLKLPNSQFKIIGPNTSTVLRSMVKEARSLNPPRSGVMTGMKMLCATSTASDSFLLMRDPTETAPVGYATAVTDLLFKQTGISFIRTTLTDESLCANLVDELNLRLIPSKADNAVKLSKEKHRLKIALVSEWDTFYGRALPHNFRQKVLKEADVRCYVYLRGIDGKSPGDTSSPTPTSGTDANAGASKPRDTKFQGGSEAPEGTNQADYLRRLADSLGEWDAELRQTQDGRLDAVGVLGTDVYDTLLILQALRDKLPNPIFFTTTLDARYADPAEWKAAHNLIIVAPFGPKLDGYIQTNIPPFRDSYQTATFTATLTALGGLPSVENLQCPLEDPESVFGRPRRFEVGREGFYDLTVREDMERAEDQSRIADEIKNGMETSRPQFIQPPRKDYAATGFINWGGIGLLIGTATVMALGMVLSGIKPDNFSLQRTFRSNAFWVMLAGVISFVLIASIPWADGDRAAPLALYDGLSPWPTQVFRIFATLLCVYFIVNSICAIKENNDEIERVFHISDAFPQRNESGENLSEDRLLPLSTSPTLFLHRWKAFQIGTSRIAQPVPRKIEPASPVTVFVQNLWWEYRRRSGARVRLLRSLLMTVLFVGISIAILHVWPRTIPGFRGRFTACLNDFILFVSGFVAIFFTMFTFDSAYVTKRLLDYLMQNGRSIYWPNKAFDDFRYAVDFRELTEYLAIRFIAVRTRVAGYMIFYPFIIWVLLIAARNSWFYNWPWSTDIVVIYAISIGFAATGAFMLHIATERARNVALEAIQKRYLRCKVDGSPDAAVLKRIKKLVVDEKEGSFSLFWGHPVLAAILLPSGSVGIWVLIEYLARAGGS
jgi:hypothetical protein